jgi:AcrR family transcriptional regulator
MTEAATVRRSRITPEREAELYTAVLDLLREVGYDALTMDAVATRTRASKATLYRQWGGKAELVVKALRHHKPLKFSDMDTGSLRGDFLALAARQDDCQMEQDSALMRGLAMAAHGNPDLLKAFREWLVEPEMEELRLVPSCIRTSTPWFSPLSAPDSSALHPLHLPHPLQAPVVAPDAPLTSSG